MRDDIINPRVVMKSLIVIGAICFASILLFIPIVFFDFTTLKEITRIWRIIDIRLLTVFAVIDTILIFIVSFQKPLLNNGYYLFHKRHGIIKITLLKIVLFLLVIYTIEAPVIGSGRLALTAELTYAVVIITVAYDLLKRTTNTDIGEKGKHNKSLQ